MESYAPMAGKRERLARILDAVGFNTVVTALRARTPSTWLSVLTYHRVGVAVDDAELAGDMYDASPEQFDAQLAHLSQHFHFVSTDDVIGMLDGRPLPPNPVMITFDDGYIDNLKTAMPMLLRHGAKATFFIPTYYVDERRLFWWDRISQLVGRCERETIALDYPRKLSFDRQHAIKPLTELVKAEYALDLDRYLEHVADRCGVACSIDEERALVDDLLMSWDDIRELDANGMDIQSHTWTHRVVQTLPPDQLAEELLVSRETLEQQLGKPVRGLAYPVGYPIAGQRAISDAVAAAGYRVAFSAQTGPIATWRRLDRFDLNRIAADPDASGALFRAIMALPLLSPAQRKRGPQPISEAASA